MKLEIHLHFNGCCREAFEYYSDALDGTIEGLLSYRESGAAEHIPDHFKDKIVHGTLSLANLVIAGADMLDGYERPKGFNILLQLESAELCKSKFELLAKDGEIVMPLQSTFWSPSYGIVRDKFDIPWEVNCSD